jgi:hypothetical protein
LQSFLGLSYPDELVNLQAKSLHRYSKLVGLLAQLLYGKLRFHHTYTTFKGNLVDSKPVGKYLTKKLYVWGAHHWPMQARVMSCVDLFVDLKHRVGGDTAGNAANEPDDGDARVQYDQTGSQSGTSVYIAGLTVLLCCVVQLQAGTPAVDCVLFPMIMIVQESICVYDKVVEVLDVLHHERKLAASLGPQRARFDDQRRKLRLLYRV